MTVKGNASAKLKHKRISAPKSRSGCITWIRHLKCDETKPTCDRCSKDQVKCDGYAMPKPRKQNRRKPRPTVIVKMVPTGHDIVPLCSNIHDYPGLTSIERLYFQHFLQWTSKQLSLSAESSNFWLRYALPMAYQSDAIQYSIIAVGASHRLFMARSLGHSSPDELRYLTTRQYNKAIASMIPSMSTGSTQSLHQVLICCLLFISFEGLNGRYDELLRHLSAGIALFRSPLPSSTGEERAVTERLVEMFCRLGVESSNFLEADPSLSGITEWFRNDSEQHSQLHVSFDSLDEASYALRQLDILYDDKPWHFEGSDEDDKASLMANSNNTLQEALREWASRFDAFVQTRKEDLSSKEQLQYRNLCLRQKYWQMAIDSSASEEAASKPQTFEPFLEAATEAASPLIALSQPTFSLDGDLISGLAFVASTTKDDETKARALALLSRLNRREGILDSHDIVEMHNLADALEHSETEPDFSELWEPKAQAGIPKIIEGLRRSLGTLGL
ncbi:hypothetical protein FSARC_8896 [Fusarium sarcochroum]|uniref:Zn(2)-C6 fungal-type domain-containing protein n=1 Tax=Fusarium sarcochroum TaxID=1208366 RepID=A0A8H4X6G9_9HYPO|nr:hypothetical protein FSARC_8896 [Fusarium sarcochroum]